MGLFFFCFLKIPKHHSVYLLIVGLFKITLSMGYKDRSIRTDIRISRNFKDNLISNPDKIRSVSLIIGEIKSITLKGFVNR